MFRFEYSYTNINMFYINMIFLENLNQNTIGSVKNQNAPYAYANNKYQSAATVYSDQHYCISNTVTFKNLLLLHMKNVLLCQVDNPIFNLNFVNQPNQSLTNKI